MSQKQVQQLSTNLVQTQKTTDVIEQVEKQEEVSKQNNDQIHEKDNQNDEFPSTTVKADQIKVDEDELSDNQLQSFQTDSPQKANQYKNNGNQLFKSGKCTEAIMEYQRGLKYTNDKTLRATLYSNMVISFIKLQDFAYAKKYCKKVLKEDQNHRKGRMNLARCYQEQKKIEEAYEQYKKLQQNLSGAPERDVKYIKDKLSQLKPKIDELNETRKKQVVDGLKNIGNSILGYFGMSLDNFKLEQGAGGGYNISFKQ